MKLIKGSKKSRSLRRIGRRVRVRQIRGKRSNSPRRRRVLARTHGRRSTAAARLIRLHRMKNRTQRAIGKSRIKREALHQSAFDAGKQAAKAAYDIRLVNEAWNDFLESKGFKQSWQKSGWGSTAWKRHAHIHQSFLAGLHEAASTNESARALWSNSVLIPTRKSTAAIVTCLNEEQNIAGVMAELGRLPLTEAIVIVNGSTDRSFEVIRTRSDAMIVHYDHPVGHDVGRAIGAKMTNADIVLFLDGDITVTAEQLLPFITAIDSGLDIALNDINPYIGVFNRWDSVTMMKQFLNLCYQRRDLGSNSMTAIPHALSRKAIEVIGPTSLMVPPKAMAQAMIAGLRIGASNSIDVIHRNRIRRNNVGTKNELSDLIIGDHLEALWMAMSQAGNRLSYADRLRKRPLLGGG